MAVEVIALAPQKGDVGKTTFTANLGASLQQLGQRILLVDIDPEGSLTVYSGLTEPASLSAPVADVFLARATLSKGIHASFQRIIRQIPFGIDLASSSNDLLNVELLLNTATNRKSRKYLA